MALAFPPDPGTVVNCRFPAAGTVVGAEMVKIRPAVVVGRALEGRRELVTVGQDRVDAITMDSIRRTIAYYAGRVAC